MNNEPKGLRIITPVACQNGHINHFLTIFAGGEIVKQKYILELCSCPKGDFGEGFRAIGDDYIQVVGEEQ